MVSDGSLISQCMTKERKRNIDQEDSGSESSHRLICRAFDVPTPALKSWLFGRKMDIGDFHNDLQPTSPPVPKVISTKIY